MEHSLTTSDSYLYSSNTVIFTVDLSLFFDGLPVFSWIGTQVNFLNYTYKKTQHNADM